MKQTIENTILATLLLILIAVAIWGGMTLKAQSDCLGAGYKEGKVDFTLTAYCIKRVDQTDIVVPLEDLQP